MLRARLASFLERHPPELLHAGLKGLEKESLRIAPDGTIARTDHPRALGCALTHPWVTTDYAEAMLELVTPACPDIEETLTFLDDLHVLVHRSIGEELLWPASMPCILRPGSVRIANYGTSAQGLLRHVYRIGLGHRYGRLMQTISGIHFNYSFPDALWEADGQESRARRDEGLMAVLRNLMRVAWLPCYLYGASPAMCRSYRPGTALAQAPWAEDTRYEPYATTLRLSDIGYQNRSQAPLRICLDSLASYVRTLEDATRTPDPAYEKIGVRRHGRWRQLSTAVLQTENEYYTYARPKPRKTRDERPLRTLSRDGVRYLEIRLLDLDPEAPRGLFAETLRVLELLLWRAYLLPSPPLSDAELFDIHANVRLVAYRGRAPELTLATGQGRRAPLTVLAAQILDDLDVLAEAMDRGHPTTRYAFALGEARRRIADPDETPSARQLHHLEERGLGFASWALERAREHARHFREKTYSDPRRATIFDEARDRSCAEQARLEHDPESLEDYLARYLA